MVLTDAGLTALRDFTIADMDSGQCGTSNFPADKSQTGLITAIAETLNTLQSPKVKSKNTITVTHVVTTSEANSSIITEWEILSNTNSVDYNRIVLSGLTKDSQTQLNMIQVFVFERI